MTTTSNILITLIAFIGVVTILGVNAGQDIAIIQGETNQSNVNLTFRNATTGATEIKPIVCDYSGSIPLLSDFIWAVDCTAKYVGFVFGLLTISFNDIWVVTIILVPVLVALGYLLVRELIRGSGG